MITSFVQLYENKFDVIYFFEFKNGYFCIRNHFFVAQFMKKIHGLESIDDWEQGINDRGIDCDVIDKITKIQYI